MTREEAIKHLETYSTTNGSGQTSQAQHEEAKRIAIEALEQEPVYFPPCVDCNTKMNEIREAYDKAKESECQQDHAILKAHADGANEVLDRIKEAREEVANYSDFHREHLFKTNPNYDVEQGQYLAYEKCLQIIDKLIAEVEGTSGTNQRG